MRTFLNKPLVVWGMSIFFYWVSLFPARFGADTNSLIILLENDQSTAHWTALYFRTFQVITFDGRIIWLGSLICLLILALSLENMLRAVARNEIVLKRARLIIALTPFFGVFGMTLDHQLFTTVGFINCLAYCFNRRIEILPSTSRQYFLYKYIWLSLSFLFLQMTFQGMLISCIFFFLILARTKALLLSILVALFSITSATVFQVSTEKSEVSAAISDLRMVPFLGDIKCVVQHPRVKLTDLESQVLAKVGGLENWQNPTSCIVADNAFFALHGSSKYQKEIIRTWLSLATRYPQLVLIAHIQRSSMALPPPFFRGQPNMVPTNDLEPAGIQLSVELHQWSELFKTSIDNVRLKENRPQVVRFLEPLPLLLAFLFNQNSQLWGWGGLWLLISLIILILRRKENSPPSELITLVPLFLLSLFLFVMSPASACRYVMPQILFGLILLLEYSLTRLQSLGRKL
jgi:hypothetical protein